MQILTEASKKQNFKMEKVNTALNMMVLDKKLGDKRQLVTPFIQANADVNAVYEGETALQRAARQNKLDIALLLLDSGADPILMTERHGREKVVNLFTDIAKRQHFACMLGPVMERVQKTDKIAKCKQLRQEAMLADRDKDRMTDKEWGVLTENLSEEKLRSALKTWGTMLKKQAQRPFWKDPIYNNEHEHKPLPLGMLTDVDLEEILANQEEANRCGDSWCSPSFLYWYVSIPDKMERNAPNGRPNGYSPEHQGWIQTPFNGPEMNFNSKGRGEEITVPWKLAPTRVKPVALVKYKLASKEERDKGEFLCEKGKDDMFADRFLFTKYGQYRKDDLNPEQWRDLKKGFEQAGPCGAYFTGADRGKGAKMTGGMELFPDFVKQAEKLESQEWQPVMLNAWRLRDSEDVSSNSDPEGYNYKTFKVGAMLDCSFDLETGRALPGSKVMSAHGAHPLYLKQMLEVGLDRNKFKSISSKVPTFKSQKQFITLGGGVYTTTQLSKASQYSAPVNSAWVDFAKEDLAEAWNFEDYEKWHDKCWGAEYPTSMMRESAVYLLILEVDVSNIFPLYAGTPDLQKPNVPMFEWASYYKEHQHEYKSLWDEVQGVEEWKQKEKKRRGLTVAEFGKLFLPLYEAERQQTASET